jgi:succinate-acetate transporter protein
MTYRSRIRLVTVVTIVTILVSIGLVVLGMIAFADELTLFVLAGAVGIVSAISFAIAGEALARWMEKIAPPKL